VSAQPAQVAAEVLGLVGGPANVTALTRCWARLRFELADPSLADAAAVTALPAVAIAVHQHGQFQVALRSGLVEVFDELQALLAR
jgi:phosphotransferase system IIB component